MRNLFALSFVFLMFVYLSDPGKNQAGLNKLLDFKMAKPIYSCGQIENVFMFFSGLHILKLKCV